MRRRWTTRSSSMAFCRWRWRGRSRFVIASSPARFRPLMIPGIVEKFGHVAGVAVLYGQGRLSVADATAAGPDLLLGILFVAAFAMTPKFIPSNLESVNQTC